MEGEHLLVVTRGKGLGGRETIWDLDSGDEDGCGGDDDNDQPEETVFFREKAIEISNHW